MQTFPPGTTGARDDKMNDINTFFFVVPNLMWFGAVMACAMGGVLNFEVSAATVVVIVVDVAIVNNLFFNFDEFMNKYFFRV